MDFTSVLEDISNLPSFNFIRDISKIAKLEVFIVGGALRDLSLNLDFSDIDLKVTGINGNSVQYEEIEYIEEILIKHFIDRLIKYKHETLNFIVYRVWTKLRETDITQTCIDLSIQTSKTIPDFKINSLMYDIKKKEVIDSYGFFKSISNKLIESCGDSLELVQTNPISIFRAINYRIKFGYSIEVGLLDNIKANVSRTRLIFSEISLRNDDIWRESLLYNMFSAFRWNPQLAFISFKEMGILQELESFICSKLYVKESNKTEYYVHELSPSCTSLEICIGFVLSVLSNEIYPENPIAAFAKIKYVLSLDMEFKFYTNFVNVDGINYFRGEY